MCKKIFQLIVFYSFTLITVFAQNDTSTSAPMRVQPSYAYGRSYLQDSIAYARWFQRQDSIKSVQDSLKMGWIVSPNPNRPNKFIDSLIKFHTIENGDFAGWAQKFKLTKNRYDSGSLRSKGEIWVLGLIVLLVLFFAIIKFAFSKELEIIVQSLYSNRVLAQINKEDTLFNSWPFIFLYVLFGFTIGIFLYLCGRYYKINYAYTGFQWFFILSMLVLGLFTLKIILLRVLGFLFDIQRIVREYISILYLSYFNTAIFFLPLVIAFSLSPFRYASIYIYLAIALLCSIFVLQFIRAGANVLSNYQFSKTYLFIYLCTLEICPLLILIKVLMN